MKILGTMLIMLIAALMSQYAHAENSKFPYAGLNCKTNGNKKIVWINTTHGSYALNGQAIKWVQQNKLSGYPLQGADGKDFKIGRDHINPLLLSDLIQKGLEKCK
ncbi:hypothetical protein [Maridesulfovibrio zosterae]|uniref:hypothetical protein n=1 Tax=Maridesulfovibrio zosterae TaxID=82171 RepID=UPI0004897C29|nr:hypothetical protein [Maridesulfovibrio zosterae]